MSHRVERIYRVLLTEAQGRNGLKAEAARASAYLLAMEIGGSQGLPQNPVELANGSLAEPALGNVLTEVMPSPPMDRMLTEVMPTTPRRQAFEDVVSRDFTSSRLLTEVRPHNTPQARQHHPRHAMGGEREFMRSMNSGGSIEPFKVFDAKLAETEEEWLDSMSKGDREEMLMLAGVTPSRNLNEG